jgi:hypothetical protein
MRIHADLDPDPQPWNIRLVVFLGTRTSGKSNIVNLAVPHLKVRVR